jgi:hypothetical protein
MEADLSIRSRVTGIHSDTGKSLDGSGIAMFSPCGYNLRLLRMP